MIIRSAVINRNRYGFTLMEVSLAILMISVGLLAIFALFPLGLRESERGIRDTNEAMFADDILSSMEGYAQTITNWTEWTDMNAFINVAKYGVDPISAGWTISPSADPPQAVLDKSSISDAVQFPKSNGRDVRFKIIVTDIDDSGRRKRIEVKVMSGRFGVFNDLEHTFVSEFIYMGM